MLLNSDGKVFYGWWIVLASSLCISTGPGPLVLGSFGVFLGPLTEEFGWSRAELSGALSLLVVVTAISLPVVGNVVDRFGSRIVLLMSMAVLAICFCAIPLFVTELWHLTLIFVLIGSLAVGTNNVPYMPVLSAWFFRNRGLAIGIAASGIGLGYFYVPLLSNYLIENYSWRAGYYALAAIVVLIAMPLVLLVLRETPASMGQKPDGSDGEVEVRSARRDVGLTMPEILRNREFWILIVIFIALSFVLNGMLSHLVPALTDRGTTSADAAGVAALMGATVFFGRILVGFLVDRIFAPHVAAGFFALSTLGMLLFASGGTGPVTYFAAIMLGLSLGAETDLVAYLGSRYLGLRSFGTAYGILFAAVLVGTAAGPILFALSFESAGSYISIMRTAVGLSAFAAALTFFLGPFPDWERERVPA